MPVTFVRGETQCLYSMLEMMLTAKDTIRLSTFVLQGNGIPGRILVDTLLKCTAHKIQILVNGISHYHALRYFAAQNTRIELRIWHQLFFNANHAKFLVIDNKEVFVTGMNIEESNFIANWSDSGIQLSDTIIAEKLVEFFDMLFRQSTIVPRTINTTMIMARIPSTSFRRGETYVSPNPIPIQLVNQVPTVVLDHRRKEVLHTRILLDLFSKATTSIRILSPNIIDSCVHAVLLECLKKKVQVQIATNFLHNDIYQLLLGHTETALLCTLAETVLLYTIEIRYVNTDYCNLDTRSCKTVANYPIGINHSKVFVVDDLFLYIGSANLDPLSMHTCGEVGILLDLTSVSDKADIIKFMFTDTFDKAMYIPHLCKRTKKT